MANIDTFLGSSLQNLNTLSNTVEDEKSKQIVEYLYTLTEQLQYAFNHIDEENMTDGVVQNIVKEETESQYAHFTETETSITAVIQGLNAAQQAVKVVFDADGLTIKNGGFKIVNTSNVTTMSVSTAGNVDIVGKYTTREETQSGNTWKAVLDGGSIKFYKGSSNVAGIGYNGGEQSILGCLKGYIANDSYINSGTSYWAILTGDATYGGRLQLRNKAKNNVGVGMSGESSNGSGSISIFNHSTDSTIGELNGDANGHGHLSVRNKDGSGRIYTSYNTAGTEASIYADNFTQLSSRRYKTDINDMSIEDANKLLNQQFVKFRYKDRDTYNYGLIAEDTDIEEAVTLDEQGRPDAIDYTKLIPYMGRLIQEQEKRIRRLEDERDN